MVSGFAWVVQSLACSRTSPSKAVVTTGFSSTNRPVGFTTFAEPLLGISGGLELLKV
jgi:hypothetical protein